MTDPVTDLRLKARRAIADAAPALAPGDTLVVALSGGPDSVALLDVLTALGYRCIAAHCNFHLRGPESLRDHQAARQTALSLGAEFVDTHFDVDARCRQTGESVEMACRSLRYPWFEDIRASRGAAYIAVGHHRGDQAETFFLNLLRGAGLSGLRAMLPLSGHILRPLLDASRADIDAYLAARGLSAVVDSTNADTRFRRNALRHTLLPALRAVDPGADAAIARTQAHLREAESLLTALVAERARRYTSADGAFDIAALADAEPQAAAFAYYMLAPHGFSRDVVDSIVAAAHSPGSRLFHSGGATPSWLLHRGTLRPRRPDADDAAVSADHPGLLPGIRADIVGPDGFRPARNPRVAWFDADALLRGNPLFTLRPWRHADRLRPFGLGGRTRLVSDILSDAKTPLDAKARVRVLTRNDDILWIPGLRPSSLFPVTPTTTSILRLTADTDP